MQCCIYRSTKKVGSYLYITEKNNFSAVPEELLQLFGQPQFSFQFNLTEKKSLALVDIILVKQHLQTQGFFLQMPPPQESINRPKQN
jgi:uncharacterized protein YcgL (UPF0745 family)